MTHRPSDLPEETPGRVDIALVIPVREGLILVARRPEGSHLAGLWEFPGGKVEPGEEPAAAADRELTEETGLTATDLQPLLILVHDYADRPLRFHVFVARDPEGAVRLSPPRESAWVGLDGLRALDMPPANQPMVRALDWRLGRASPGADCA